MSIKIPEGITESFSLIDGVYDFRVESMEPMETGTGKLGIKLTLRVLKGPGGSKGLMHFEQFTLGSNEDPSATQEATWLQSFGAKQLKGLCAKAGVKFVGDLARVSQEMEGQKVSGRIVGTIQPKFNKDGTENPWAGKSRIQVKDWFAPGTGPASTTEPVKALIKKAVKAPPPPADDDEDEEEEEAPRVKSKSRLAAKPADDEDDD